MFTVKISDLKMLVFDEIINGVPDLKELFEIREELRIHHTPLSNIHDSRVYQMINFFIDLERHPQGLMRR